MSCLGKAGWVVGVLLIVGMTAEVMARVDDAIRQGTPLLASPAYTDLIMHDSLGIRGRPFARFQKWELNSAGFRGDEISREPNPECVRVVVLGASETFGYYETRGREYPAQLADSLSKAGCYEVINAAVAGLSLPGQIQLWDRWVSRFRPDIVVVYAPPAFYLGDEEPQFPAAPSHASARDGAAMNFDSRLLDRLRDRIEYPEFLQRKRVERSIERSVAGKPEGWLYRQVPADRLTLYRMHLDSLVTDIKRNGSIPVLVTHAMRFSDPPRTEEEGLLLSWRKFTPRATGNVLLAFERAAAGVTRALAHERGIALVDVASMMTGRTEWFADFTHFDDDGASVVAGNIARTIERLASQRLAVDTTKRTRSVPR